MKTLGVIIVLATAVAVLYGMLFSFAFPLIEIHSGITSLFALMGILTSLVLIGVFNWFSSRSGA